MNCIECYWSSLDAPEGTDRICCNKDSPRYNETMPGSAAERSGCGKGETRQAVDYRTLNPWEFARKYYM